MPFRIKDADQKLASSINKMKDQYEEKKQTAMSRKWVKEDDCDEDYMEQFEWEAKTLNLKSQTESPALE